MSKATDIQDFPERRRKMLEMALSDRDSAPVYQLMYRKEYGVEPEQDAGVIR